MSASGGGGGHGKVAIVTSGDGGWVHLGPDVAEFLAGEGYLSSFTSRSDPLPVEDVPRDCAALDNQPELQRRPKEAIAWIGSQASSR